MLQNGFRWRLGLTGTWTLLLAIAIAASGTGAGASQPSELQEAKAATARYHSVKQAQRDGYLRASPCESSPAGGMGIHYMKPELAADAVVDPKHPELLLYAPDRRGRLELVAVEYFVPAADQEPPLDDSDTPDLFGREFDGPMEGHAPGMPHHYDLHVWLWASNPSGMFSPWNPRVSCP